MKWWCFSSKRTFQYMLCAKPQNSLKHVFFKVSKMRDISSWRHWGDTAGRRDFAAILWGQYEDTCWSLPRPRPRTLSLLTLQPQPAHNLSPAFSQKLEPLSSPRALKASCLSQGPWTPGMPGADDLHSRGLAIPCPVIPDQFRPSLTSQLLCHPVVNPHCYGLNCIPSQIHGKP